MNKGVYEIKFTAQTAEAAAASQKFFSQLMTGVSRIGGISSFLTNFGAQIVSGLTIGALIKFEQQAINTADAIQKLSEKVGVAVKTIDGLRRQGITSDLHFPEIEAGLGLFNDKLATAVRQGGNALQVFRDLGISLLDVNGVLRPTEEILKEVADKFAQMPNGPQKIAAAMDLFGRSGRQWIPLLNQGAEGMRKMSEQSIIDDATAQNAEKFNDTLATLKSRMDDVFLALAKEILPSMTQFVETVLKAADDSGDLEFIVSALATGLRILATVLVNAWTQMRVMSEFLETNFGIGLENVRVTVSLIVTLFERWWGLVKSLTADLAKLGGAWIKANSAIPKILQGDFAGAKDVIAQAGREAFGAGKDAVGSLTETVTGSASDIGSTVKSIFNNYVTGIQGFLQDTMPRLQQWSKSIQAIWKPKDRPATPDDGKASDKGASTGGKAVISETARQLIEQIDKAFAESTQSKLDVLATEQAALMKKLDEELKGTLKYEEEKTKVTAIYAAKRAAIVREETDARFKLQLATLDNEIAKIEGDPLTSALEKRRALLPLLERETELIRQQSIELRRRATDPSMTKEDRSTAEADLTSLNATGDSVSQRTTTLSQAGTVRGEFKRVLADLKTQWDGWAKGAADTFGNVFNTAIDAISAGITGLILQTTTWSQALSQIGTSILNQIVSGVVRMFTTWLLQMTIMRLAQKLFATENTTQAEASAASWAPAAVAASIASYGSAAGVGLAAYIAAIVAGSAVTAGASGAGGAFAEGGLIKGPGTGTSDSITIRASNEEYMMKNAAVKKYGVNFMDAINEGRLNMTQSSPAATRVATEGATSAGAAPVVKTEVNNHFGFMNTEAIPESWARGRKGKVWFIDMLNQTIEQYIPKR